MNYTKSKTIRVPKKHRKPRAEAHRKSLRELRAFGLWADRLGLGDSVRFTKELRSRMEQGCDAR